MLIIKHLTGPLAGKEERMDPALDRIAFGRKADCQIIYPPEETVIAREHFALVRRPPGPAGHWTIELFGEPYVEVNGFPADPGQRVPAEATFVLGRSGGPSFKLLVQADAAADNLPSTGWQDQVQPAGVRATQAGRTARLARRVAVLGAAIAVVAIGAGSYYAYREAPLRIGSDVREHLARAAFYVDTPEGVATAWPVGPHMLGTNAHVVELFAGLKAGQTMTVRSPGVEGKEYQVVDSRIHPAYRAFEAFLKQDVLQFRQQNLAPIGYDVGLLIVKEELPANSILELATDAELRGLSSGSVVALAGYPAERVLAAPVRKYGAAPELHVGTITSLSDYFFLPAPFEESQLVHHDLPTAGGASGSPIVGRSGHVIAIHSAGNSYTPPEGGARIVSGVLVNYGQRADVLRQLISGNAERALADARKYWAQQTKRFPSGAAWTAHIVAARIRDALKTDIEFTQVSEQTLSLSDQPVSNNGVLQRQRGQDFEVPGDSDSVISAYANDGSAIELYVYDRNKLVGQDNADQKLLRAVFLKPGPKTLTAWVVSKGDREVTYTLQVHKFRAKSGV
jgi:Trypsin-like peptidase domain